MGGEDKELLATITIPDYSEYLELSKNRRVKPYVQGKCRLPKKYSGSDFHWVKKGKLMVLARVVDGLIMTANPRTAGKPKYKKVNGNDIYNSVVSPHARAAMMRKLHEYFKPYLSKLEPLSDIERYPIGLELIFKIVDQGKSNIDNDNKWIWRKAVQDTMTELGIIPDDNPYILNENSEKTLLLTEGQQQELIINIYGSSN
jgi:hypothetical protein